MNEIRFEGSALRSVRASISKRQADHPQANRRSLTPPPKRPRSNRAVESRAYHAPEAGPFRRTEDYESPSSRVAECGRLWIARSGPRSARLLALRCEGRGISRGCGRRCHGEWRLHLSVYVRLGGPIEFGCNSGSTNTTGVVAKTGPIRSIGRRASPEAASASSLDGSSWAPR